MLEVDENIVIQKFLAQKFCQRHRSRTFLRGYSVQLTWRDVKQALHSLSLSLTVTRVDPILEPLECVPADL